MNLQLDPRPFEHPVVAGSVVPGAKAPNWSIKRGCTLLLKVRGVDVYLRVDAVLPNKSITGMITSIDLPDRPYKGLREGDVLVVEERFVWSVLHA